MVTHGNILWPNKENVPCKVTWGLNSVRFFVETFHVTADSSRIFRGENKTGSHQVTSCIGFKQGHAGAFLFARLLWKTYTIGTKFFPDFLLAAHVKKEVREGITQKLPVSITSTLNELAGSDFWQWHIASPHDFWFPFFPLLSHYSQSDHWLQPKGSRNHDSKPV